MGLLWGRPILPLCPLVKREVFLEARTIYHIHNTAIEFGLCYLAKPSAILEPCSAGCLVALFLLPKDHHGTLSNGKILVAMQDDEIVSSGQGGSKDELLVRPAASRNQGRSASPAHAFNQDRGIIQGHGASKLVAALKPLRFYASHSHHRGFRAMREVPRIILRSKTASMFAP